MKNIACVSMAALTAVSSVAATTTIVSNADTVKNNKVVEMEVPVTLLKATSNEESMGAKAIEPNAKVIINGDKADIYVSFKGLEFMNMFGHVTNVKAYQEGKDSKLLPVDVVKKVTEKDLQKKDREFIKEIKITRNKTDEKEILLKVSVDAMSSIKANGGDPYTEENRDKGAEDVRLVLDYSKAKVVKAEKSEEKQEDKQTSINNFRIAGNNRYETAVDVSKKYFKKADTVIIANGRIFADALASSPLASTMNAPILLTETNSISDATLNEITRLNAKNVIIVGGEGSVSKSVEAKIKSIRAEKDSAVNVERISGKDRYTTSLLIAKKVRTVSPSDKVLLVSGQNFADALSVSSLATEKNIPVVLTEVSSINSNVKSELDSWNLANLTVVGGVNSVSDSVINSLNSKSKNRIAGNNRYETSVLVAKNAYPKTTGLFVASGENPADALSVGAVTGRKKTPLVLVSKNYADASLKNFVSENKINNLTIIGGVNSVSQKIENELR